MSRTARLWKGAGLLTLGGVLLSGVVALGDDGPPLASQLNDLGRQALAQGATAMAQTFFQKALALDPGNADATRGLKDTKAAQDQVVHVAFQDPAPAQPPAEPTTPPPAPGVTAAGSGQAAVTPAPAGTAQPSPAHSIVPAPAAASCQSAADQRRAHVPRWRKASGKTTSLASNSPATSSSGSRRHAAWSLPGSPPPR